MGTQGSWSPQRLPSPREAVRPGLEAAPSRATIPPSPPARLSPLPSRGCSLVCSEEGNCKLIFISILEENLNSLHGNDPRHPRESIMGFNCSQSWPIRVGPAPGTLSLLPISGALPWVHSALGVSLSLSLLLSLSLWASVSLFLSRCMSLPVSRCPWLWLWPLPTAQGSGRHPSSDEPQGTSACNLSGLRAAASRLGLRG